jgi:transcription elongation factor GreA
MAVGESTAHDRRRASRFDEKERNMTVTASYRNEVLITAAGYERLSRELDLLRTLERRRIADHVRDAREDGALEDNPTLVDLLDEQAQLERRISTLEGQLATAEVVQPPRDGRAGVGSVVRVRDLSSDELFELQLVGALESDASNGRVSTEAPIGQALLGQHPGARVEVSTPGGTTALEVLQVGRAA